MVAGANLCKGVTAAGSGWLGWAMTTEPVTERLRAVCLALPEAAEKEAWGDPPWRVRERIFALEKRGDGRISVWCRAPPGSQEILVGADPARFFVPPYVGSNGGIGMRLEDGPDRDEVAALIRRSYRLIAPQRLVQDVGRAAARRRTG